MVLVHVGRDAGEPLNLSKRATCDYWYAGEHAYFNQVHRPVGAFLKVARDFNGRYVETIILGAFLISGPDLMICGHPTTIASPPKRLAELIMNTIADCPFLFIPFANVN